MEDGKVHPGSTPDSKLYPENPTFQNNNSPWSMTPKPCASAVGQALIVFAPSLEGSSNPSRRTPKVERQRNPTSAFLNLHMITLSVLTTFSLRRGHVHFLAVGLHLKPRGLLALVQGEFQPGAWETSRRSRKPMLIRLSSDWTKVVAIRRC